MAMKDNCAVDYVEGLAELRNAPELLPCRRTPLLGSADWFLKNLTGTRTGHIQNTRALHETRRDAQSHNHNTWANVTYAGCYE